LPSPEHPTDHVVQTVVLPGFAPTGAALVVATANMCEIGAPFEFESDSQTPSVRQAGEAVELYRNTRTFAPLFAEVTACDPAFGAKFQRWASEHLDATADTNVYAVRRKLVLDHDKFWCTSATRINQVRLASLPM
jgi:hypothetical protein